MKNGLLDIAYLSNTLKLAGITPAQKTRINNELNETIAVNNTGTLVKLLDDSALPPGDIAAAADILNQENILIG